MKIKNFQGKNLFAAALFVGSLFILGIKLLTPASIRIYVEGAETAVAQIPGYFTLADVTIVAVFSIILGVSGAYLLFSAPAGRALGEVALEGRKVRWKEIAKTLKDEERSIYETILDSGGMIFQSELVEKLGLSKSSVSRSLDLLESKGLVERKRRGMANLVLLK